jgi:hypothetical protein
MALLCTFAWSVLAVIFLPYLLHHVLLGFFKGRDLKKRYNAEWALVTGASSGARLCSIHCHGLRVQLENVISNEEQYDTVT